MAIKKGAFDLYVNQRQLPNRENREVIKKNHFFDDIIFETENGGTPFMDHSTVDTRVLTINKKRR